MESRIHGENDGWQGFSMRGVRVVHGVRRSGFVAQPHRHRQRDILGALSGRGARRSGGGVLYNQTHAFLEQEGLAPDASWSVLVLSNKRFGGEVR